MLRVVLPQRCLYAAAAETCSLFIDHYRSRKTGPRFPVAVVGCSRHPVGCYTLYPPGHIRYGRQPVVPCSPSGALLLDGDTGQPLWPATLFAAAIDAAARVWWPSHSPADDERRRRTQGCRLEQAGQLLGLHDQVDSSRQEPIATRLRVPTMTLRRAASGWTSSWQARGTAIMAMLQAVPIDASLLDRILAAGAVAQRWPPPKRWDRGRRTWVSSGSHRPERPVAVAPQSRAPPPTNLRTSASAGAIYHQVP